MVGLLGSYILKQNRTSQKFPTMFPAEFLCDLQVNIISSCVVATTGKSVLMSE